MQLLEGTDARTAEPSLTRSVAVALAAVLLAVGAQARDVEAAAIGVALLGASALLRWRHGFVPRIALGALFLDTLVWMAPAAYSNVTHRDPLLSTARAGSLAVLALAGLVTIVAQRSDRRARRTVAAAVAVGCMAVLGLSRLPGVGDDVRAQPGDVLVGIRTNEFSREDLVVTAGPAGIAVTNHDLFWHTFTIDELGIDVRVPNGATRRVELDLEPGTYRFVCAIPGHEQAGMVGRLVVE